jgi:hypothetical protein
MKIKCKICGEYFFPYDETLALMSDGYLTGGDVNTYKECWEMLTQQPDDLLILKFLSKLLKCPKSSDIHTMLSDHLAIEQTKQLF